MTTFDDDNNLFSDGVTLQSDNAELLDALYDNYWQWDDQQVVIGGCGAVDRVTFFATADIRPNITKWIAEHYPSEAITP